MARKHPLLSNREELRTLKDLGKILPGGPYEYDTVKSWCVKGRKALDGERVMMERVKGPVGWCSSVPAFWRFWSRVNEE